MPVLLLATLDALLPVLVLVLVLVVVVLVLALAAPPAPPAPLLDELVAVLLVPDPPPNKPTSPPHAPKIHAHTAADPIVPRRMLTSVRAGAPFGYNHG
jgi:hypothetical protein